MFTDEEFLAVVSDERRQSIGFGFENDSVVSSAREKALNYYKGEMPDVPAAPNRSKAMSSDVLDAVETALPDLVEIFVGGDDFATFQAQGPGDEDQAQQETDFVRSVIFDQNAGFMLVYSMIKDALVSKIGVFKVWWQDDNKTVETQHQVHPDAFPMVQALAGAKGMEVADVDHQPGASSFTLRREVDAGAMMVAAVAPEDFCFATDTTRLCDTVYCAMRSRPRAQKLIEDGYDPDLVDKLPGYTDEDVATEQARDTAGENQQRPNGATKPLRMVEIVEHYVRVDADGDGKTELWRVVTGDGEAVLLEREQVDEIPFGVITPYPQTHRLIGLSLADLLLEIQRIKTALLRMLLDSGYFALNQRVEVATDRANAFTISDLLRNEPGAPIRSKSGDAIRAVGTGGLSFDVPGALEYVSTIAEQRTGIVRNAQGLNPDTLHDTADGARQLIGAAQKRLRMIARVFAETGFKDLVLIVHALLRKHGTQLSGQIGGEWVNADPSTWPERKALTINIGVGSGGRDHDVIAGNQLLTMMAQVVTQQGGLSGPLLQAKNVYAALKRQTERLGFKGAEEYWNDPATWQPPPASPPPEMAKAQLQAQVAMYTAQQKANLAAQDQQQKANLAQAQTEQELELKRQEIAGELTLKGGQIAGQTQVAAIEAGHRMHLAEREAQVSTSGSDVHVGGLPG